MNELIKYFNNKYSKTYGKIAYPRTTIQIYRVYQAIKSYGINDDKLVELLHNVKLPKPKNTEEWELYVYCLYNMDDSESERKIKDISNKLEILPVKNTHQVIRDGVPVSQQNITLDENNYKAYIFNDEQITIPDSLVLEDFENKFLAIASHSKGVLNAVISYNDGVNDITKEIELTRDENFTSNYFDYSDYTESSILNITFGFDYGINKFFIYIYYMKQPMKSPIFYEVKKVSLSYSYITNLLDDDYLKSIDYSKINNVPYKLTALVEGSTKTLKTGEYASLFDNLFIWDANKINERLDDTSGVKKNEYYAHNIQVKQKDSEGIGYGQYIPSTYMSDYKLFIKAGPDVIVKVYQHRTKQLLNEIKDFYIGEYKEIMVRDGLNGSDGIFIAFTVKDDVTDFYANTYVSDLVLCKSSGFLTKQEVDNKVDKVSGKGLSTVDFTTAYETKLKKLENYNDTTIKKDIQTINTQLGDIAKKTIVEGNRIYLAKADGTKLDEGTDLPTSSGSSEADDITIKDTGNNFTATNVEGALLELFQSASNGKTLVANAVTGKGVTTNPSDSFQTMATNIGNIKTTTNTVGQNPLNKCGSRKFKFAIFSDVHTKADTTQNPNVKLREAIAKVQELGCAFIAVTGDLCNYDVENELNQYKAEIDANATIPVYEVTGNHDATQKGLNTTLWKTITGQDPYYEIIKDNEVFLFVSQASWGDDSNSKIFPKAYQDWLTSKLEEHKTKNRVFFFFHQYMPDCEGFGYRNGTQNQSYLTGSLPYFTNLINTYKNVIWFSGHSHTKFEVQTNYPNVNAYNKNGEICTMIHTPTLQEGEYYIATVYDHLVELEGYKNGTVVNDIYFAIDDYIYTSPVQSVVLNKSTLNFANTDTQTIIATVTPSNQQDLLTWETSNADVATVIGGVVTPVGNGNCTITAKCGDKSAKCNVVVDISESELYYSITSTLNGCTLSNSATKIKSEETYVATITESANTTINTVTVKMGGVDISSTAYNQDSKTIGINIVTGNIEIVITVNKLVTGLSVSPTSVSFKSTGETKQLTVVKTPSDAIGDITWETSNADVAVVTNGLVTVTATSSGSCTITAKCNGHSAQCNVIVEILQKEVAYSLPSKTFTFTRVGQSLAIDDNNTVTFTTPLKANTRYYMRAKSLKYADGTDVNIATDKIYIVGTPWVVGASSQACNKINMDYSDFVNNDVVLTSGFGNGYSNGVAQYNYDIAKYGNIEKFTTFCIKSSSSSPVTFPKTITLTGFEIFTYGETFTV